MQERYQRQTAFLPIGEDGQRRLQQGKVLIVGCGALGGTVADQLVRAGVGVDSGLIGLIDPDVVQIDNLHRQVLFTEQDAEEKRYKVEAARNALLAANSKARLEIQVGRFDENNTEMSEEFDLLIDATDNFLVRKILNRAAIRYGKPLISAGISGASGQLLVVLPETAFPGDNACLECLFDFQNKKKKDYKTVHWPAILGPLPGFFASLQALEALKILSGNTEAVNSNLLSVDLWKNRILSIPVKRNPLCPACSSKNPTW